MNNIFEYKGYHTKVEFNSESFTLRGKIEGINDFVDFECNDVNLVEKEFQNAVDDYLEFCKEVGKEPEKEYKGTFNVRIEPELHRKLAIMASKNGESMNAAISKAVKEYVGNGMNEKKNITNVNITLEVGGELVKTQSSSNYEKSASYKYSGNVIQFNNFKTIGEEMVN